MSENTAHVDKKVDTTVEQQIAATPAPAPVEQAPKAKKENKILAWMKAHKMGIIATVIGVIIGAIGFIVGILFERNHPDDTAEDCDCDDCNEPQDDWYDLVPADQTKVDELIDTCQDLDFPNSDTEDTDVEIVP